MAKVRETVKHQELVKEVAQVRGKSSTTYQRRVEVSDEFGTGKFLIVENLTPGIVSLPHPDAQNLGRSDVSIPGYESEVIDDLWLDVPHFMRRVLDGTIRVYRTNQVPGRIDMSVPASLALEDPQLEQHALGIAKNQAYDFKAKQIIDLKPMEGGKELDKDYLKNIHVKFLKNVRYREEHFRNRPQVIADIDNKLETIRNL